ncbi:Hsp20/alpha crystallin family protein [Maridesulfovibrio hydrothermalis]|uniref:Heat shock protein Hsp20 n=1 Tax=Maridesulfovibrio hydrothermalis AM13 = DSM 14728 TaxID=1121451 RepID=L0R669_9BACT|nr:Hsp20/alpha crystallin family protein [Maridesulfovibrio hydrothermalis]CCO22188.1 Heat shock protein Hsp20 [Maridesulfovibrio hydrothermalis AM13 = DSM 14728]
MPNLSSWGSRELEKLKTDMDKLFNSLCHDYGIPSVCGIIDCTPRTQMQEIDQSLEVSTTMPGFQAEDLEVSVTETSMTISGEKKVTFEGGRQTSHFKKTIPLPCRVDPDNVKATFKDGILKIQLLKCVTKPHKTISIITE